jgi:hypothetical protein
VTARDEAEEVCDVPAVPPWQFLLRAVMVITGLTLLLVVKAHGVGFYFAWAMIGLALLSEGAATLIYRRRGRR